MNIAWLTHREWTADAGGAEAADFDMVARRPKEANITIFWPGGVDESLHDYDRIIVSGFYGFNSRELNIVQDVGHKSLLWLHDSQMTSHWLYTAVSTLIFCTPQHRDHDLSFQPGFVPKRVEINPGWMDPQDVVGIELDPGEDRTDALWAHRPVEHKGLDLAAEWARRNDIRLNVLVGRPRAQVLRAMWANRYFVLLSHIFDAGPRAVMEAQLAGCELIINENVGWFDESWEVLAQRLSTADQHFWDVVMG